MAQKRYPFLMRSHNENRLNIRHVSYLADRRSSQP